MSPLSCFCQGVLSQQTGNETQTLGMLLNVKQESLALAKTQECLSLGHGFLGKGFMEEELSGETRKGKTLVGKRGFRSPASV